MFTVKSATSSVAPIEYFWTQWPQILISWPFQWPELNLGRLISFTSANKSRKLIKVQVAHCKCLNLLAKFRLRSDLFSLRSAIIFGLQKTYSPPLWPFVHPLILLLLEFDQTVQFIVLFWNAKMFCFDSKAERPGVTRQKHEFRNFTFCGN